jgi:hypothetical protein
VATDVAAEKAATLLAAGEITQAERTTAATKVPVRLKNRRVDGQQVDLGVS